MSIPSTSDSLVLFDDLPGNEQNLARMTADGRVVWRATSPPEGGPYVDFEMQNGVMKAWSCSSLPSTPAPEPYFALNS